MFGYKDVNTYIYGVMTQMSSLHAERLRVFSVALPSYRLFQAWASLHYATPIFG